MGLDTIAISIGSDEAALAKAFQMFDSDNSGFLDAPELHKALLDLGLDVEQQDVTEMMLEATGDPNDTDIDYEAFLRLFSASGRVENPETGEQMCKTNSVL